MFYLELLKQSQVCEHTVITFNVDKKKETDCEFNHLGLWENGSRILNFRPECFVAISMNERVNGLTVSPRHGYE